MEQPTSTVIDLVSHPAPSSKTFVHTLRQLHRMDWMNENLYIAHKKLPHKTLRVHSARCTQCIHVSSRKLKLPKGTHTKRYKQLLPTHPFPKVELYIAVKCKNIYRVTNTDIRKEKKTHARTHTHVCKHIQVCKVQDIHRDNNRED